MTSMLSDTFFSELAANNVRLDDEAIDYLTGMLNDLSVDNGIEDIREATEEFLIDAQVPSATVAAVYSTLSKQLTAVDNNNGAKNSKKLDTKSAQPAKLSSAEKKKEDNQDILSEKQNKTVRKSATGTRRVRGNRRKQQQIDDGIENENPDIVAISQQSRFHSETLETSSTDIDMHGVCITVNNNDLLVDAHLKLNQGVRYGLVGQNGVVLMKCLSDNILVGLPQNVSILHVAQLQIYDETTTVIQEVLNADRDAMNVLREAKLIQEVMGDSAHPKDTFELNRVIYQIMVARSEAKLDFANKLATKRSGARGREARSDLIECEKSHAELLSKTPQEAVSTNDANAIVAQVFEQLGLVDIGQREAKARKILLGIGFTEEELLLPVSTFSGGWRMKIALAKSLFMNPNILLLDEPTNHLDLPSILWLQEYLLNETGGQTLVVVSHDREFLDAVTEETIIFRDKTLKYHAGNYQDYEKNTEEQRIRKQAMKDAVERRRKQILQSIQYNIQQAKSTGDDKRLGQVASRQKKLERLGMQKTEDGKRFKVSYRAGFHLGTHADIVVEKNVKTMPIKIPDPPPLRYQGPVFSMKSVSFKYPKTKTKIIDDFSLNIELGSRTVFLGSNGSGKSTLLEVLVGNLPPTSGEVYRHPLLRIGYFSQHFVDELSLDETPIEMLMRCYPSIKSDQECRHHFATVGLTGPVVLRKMKSLSGGQRNRVALALILYEAPHVLILDEITNHLDMGTVELLVDALAEYPGALVLVSHDVWFIKQLIEVQPAEAAQDADDDSDDALGIKTDFFVLKKGHPVKRWQKDMDAYVLSVMKQVRRAADKI
ncbi:P-loop containing nucleoside triphosphate hydrolase protein [Dichotomocladium elegans]|nr:P-loop containing nucleoside triphosphate hydrolase protein [Dichotomocladium elegans]